jgi:DNA-binding transcriptional LysR family regulator
MEDLNDLYFFVCVSERGSFTRAAESLEIPKSRLSRRIADLEQRLGVRLLERTTRRLHLTTEGELFLGHCQAMLVEAKAGLEALARRRSEPSGAVRIAAPVDVAQHLLSKLLPRFVEQYPKVRLEVSSGNRIVDLIEEGFDAALRVRVNSPEDPRLQSVLLRPMDLVLVSAPDLFGPELPTEPSQLEGFATLTMASSGSGVSTLALSRDDGEVKQVQLAPRLVVNDFSILAEAARAGLGVTPLPAEIAEPYLRDGSLLAILPEWRVASGQLHLVYPPARAKLPAVRAFLDFAQQTLGRAKDAP